MSRIYFLHGFLNSKEDWDEVISLLPEFECIALNYPFNPPPDSLLVGYSMGGRIALQTPAAARLLFSAHPGLASQEEKEKRWQIDQEWITKIKTLSLEKFLDEWYAQPLFDSFRLHPNFLRLRARRLLQNPEVLIDQLSKHSLAHQTRTTPINTLFVYGEKDLKYAQIYKDMNPIKIEGAGHVVHLENPRECADLIRSWHLHRYQIPQGKRDCENHDQPS